MAACALAAQTREAEYLEEAKRWTRDELDTFSHALGALILEMETQPFTDVLGRHYMDFAISHESQQWNGEFHTPKEICELMAGLIAGDTPLSEDGPITLCEPACGAGAMILAYAHNLKPMHRQRLRVTAIDISKVACDMCFINTTLWGIPAEIVHGNTISMKCFAVWENIHWITRGYLHLLAPTSIAVDGNATDGIPDCSPISQDAVQISQSFLTAVASKQGQPPPPKTIAKIQASIQQQEFDFI